MSSAKPVATLYRMKTPQHICPFGLKSRGLLRRKGYKVDDHLLTSREETDAFKAKYDVKTTPQTFIEGKRIGGYDDLRKFFSLPQKDKDAKTYTPVIAIFASAALMALAVSWAAFGTLLSMRVVEWFIAISMCLLAVQKLRDIDSFSNSFLGYDLLARRYVRYAYVYPFAELFAGVLMIAGALTWLAAPMALFIGGIGAVSVYKAVYIEKRDLKCACVGGESNVPLGFISLLENVMMVAMAIWMLVK
nr:MauE/DoxX family redox-associated membrane protein [uncultured Hyphomonas sp.]